MTLWSLPAEVEDQFEEHWQGWLDNCDQWSRFFEKLASAKDDDLLALLKRFDLMSDAQFKSAAKLRRAAENRAVPLPGSHRPTDEIITLLAAGFARGEPGSPAIPYAKLEA
jgi:hypothetical protein